MSVAESIAALREKFSDQILADSEFRGETTLVIAREAIHSVCLFCRDALKFDYLVDLSSVDNMGEDPRYEMVYELYSYATHQHLRLKASVPEDARQVDTVTDLWATANWHEREVYDMMGIEFPKHPDLRRILMWEGYPFFPLRKDFPLAGKPSEMPDVAFSDRAPLAGGPFVTVPSTSGTVAREPRSRDFE
jgi:NADH-quinone oxidoreductase subunit C